MPVTFIRCAPIVPASILPAAISTVLRATATSPDATTSSSGMARASATTPSDPPNAAAPCSSTPLGSNVEGSRPKPMRSKISSGESRDDMSANSSIVRRSRRRCTDVSTSGIASVMNPGLEPVLCREAPPCRHAASIRARVTGSMPAGR